MKEDKSVDMGQNITAGQIAQLSSELAASRKGASASASAIIECMVAAAEPLVMGLFNGGTLQERLLFTLILAGATSTLERADKNNLGLCVEISPNTLSEALNIYQLVSGKDMRPYLPQQMLEFAEKRALN